MIKKGYLIIGPSTVCGEETVWFASSLEGPAPGGAIELAKHFAEETGKEYNIISYDLQAIVNREGSEIKVTEVSDHLLLQPRCCFCGKKATETNDPDMMLFVGGGPEMVAIHWNIKKQHGCPENKANYFINGITK
jgi:hypothetical protein